VWVKFCLIFWILSFNKVHLLGLIMEEGLPQATETKTPWKITTIYTSPDGESHFGERTVVRVSAAAWGGGLGPFFDYFQNLESQGDIGSLSDLIGVSGVRFRTTPATYDYDWHHAPCRQVFLMVGCGRVVRKATHPPTPQKLIVNLNASVEIEVSDGEKKKIGAGQVFLVEDTWGKGHKSQAVDSQLRYSLFLPLEVRPFLFLLYGTTGQGLIFVNVPRSVSHRTASYHLEKLRRNQRKLRKRDVTTFFRFTERTCSG